MGRARGKYGVKAPAMSGHEIFDRWFRRRGDLDLALLEPALGADQQAEFTWCIAAEARVSAGVQHDPRCHDRGHLHTHRVRTEPRDPRSGSAGFVVGLVGLVVAWREGVLVAAAFTLRAIQTAFFGKVGPTEPSPCEAVAGSTHHLDPVTWPEKAGALLLLGATIYLGLSPELGSLVRERRAVRHEDGVTKHTITIHEVRLG